MSGIEGVGILGIGAYLPEQVRTNDWWPPEVVARWGRRASSGLVKPAGADEGPPPTEGVRLALEAMRALRDDPYKGAVSRRIRPDDMLPSQMETRAAEEALARSGVDRGEIGVVLGYSQVADNIGASTTPRIHQALGLRPDCLSTSLEGACNSFMHQLALAEQLIRGGSTRYALLVQSSGVSRLHELEDPISPWFGDGATAVVLGPVRRGHGILGMAHFTDGSFYRSLILGSPQGPWYTGNPVHGFVDDFELARKMSLMLPDFGKRALEAALARAGVAKEEVRFLATHQGTIWLRRVTQELTGLANARSADTFTWTASMGAANAPFQLLMGEREGAIQEGDVVAAWTGGTGVTYSAVILRWGP
jgi:3-oxoacyl-[acyl-carrier-protein] synthase III